MHIGKIDLPANDISEGVIGELSFWGVVDNGSCSLLKIETEVLPGEDCYNIYGINPDGIICSKVFKDLKLRWNYNVPFQGIFKGFYWIWWIIWNAVHF